MLTIEESIVVNSPRHEVWAFMTDPDNVPVYCSNVIDYHLVEGEKDKVGRKCRGSAKVAGRRVDFSDEMVEMEEDRGSKLVSEDATVLYTLQLTFADEGAGTTITWRQESESFKGVFKFADPIVLRLYARDVHSNLEKVKTLLEA